MKYNYRNHKGQWISKDHAFRKFMLTLAWYALGPVALGVLAHYATPVEVTQEVDAHVEEYIPAVDVCGLDTVECPKEETKADIAVKQIPHTSPETEARIRYLYEYAEGKVDPDEVAHTIYCESMWFCTQSAIVQNGVQEPSYCLAQIHAPSHPEFTHEQLTDPYFNIRYIVDNFNSDTWYGYNRMTGHCSNNVPEYWN